MNLRTTALAIVVIASVMLTGCNSDSSSGTTVSVSPPPPPDPRVQSVRVWPDEPFFKRCDGTTLLYYDGRNYKAISVDPIAPNPACMPPK